MSKQEADDLKLQATIGHNTTGFTYNPAILPTTAGTYEGTDPSSEL